MQTTASVRPATSQDFTLRTIPVATLPIYLGLELAHSKQKVHTISYNIAYYAYFITVAVYICSKFAFSALTMWVSHPQKAIQPCVPAILKCSLIHPASRTQSA